MAASDDAPCLATAGAAATARRIEVAHQIRTDPVAITEVDLGTTVLQCGLVVSSREIQPVTPVMADDNWLQDTSIVLLNRTNKTIVFGQITLAFPETGAGTAGNPMYVYTIALGQLPSSVAVMRNGQPVQPTPTGLAMSFGPGQKMVIRLADYNNQIRRTVVAKPIGSLTQCQIRLTSFVFDDGLRWAAGYSLPDPANPGKWKRFDPQYFPGTPTWPPNVQR